MRDEEGMLPGRMALQICKYAFLPSGGYFSSHDNVPGTGTWLRACRDLQRAVAFVDGAVLSGASAAALSPGTRNASRINQPHAPNSPGGGTVLVNCFAGLNRSGAILLAWLLAHRRSDGSLGNWSVPCAVVDVDN